MDTLTKTHNTNTFTFRNKFGENIFQQRYAHQNCETWPKLAHVVVEDVCGKFLNTEQKNKLKQYITEMKFLPGGRYLYYAGRGKKFFNNCYLLRSLEDTREDWASLSWKAESCLMTGGGIGNDYSIYREKGAKIGLTGGVSSGPISKMKMINEIGRAVMQGGSRRSAIYASLNWQHPDAYHYNDNMQDFIHIKDWYRQLIPGSNISYGQAKEKDFNFACSLDHTNISLNYDDNFLEALYGKDNFFEDENGIVCLKDQININNLPSTFVQNCYQALKTGEPGFSFNFLSKIFETLRNACTEVTSEDDSDVCNLGSVNFARIESIEELKEVSELASLFLLCGTLTADLPYKKIYDVREKNRRLGQGLMGVHEWLLQRGYKYEVTNELHSWLKVWSKASEEKVNEFCKENGISKPIAYRAIAPTGTIGILAGTTTGIEPLFATAYKQTYFKGDRWCYQFVVDTTAKQLVNQLGVDPQAIETSLDLAVDYERRIKFQADVQDYVDMAISSTINLPRWGSDNNNEDKVQDFAYTLAKYAHRLRGFTCYPDGARGGQPLIPVNYYEAISKEGQEFIETYNDICHISGKGGFCGS